MDNQQSPADTAEVSSAGGHGGTPPIRVVATRNGKGEVVCVGRQDKEGRIVQVLWEETMTPEQKRDLALDVLAAEAQIQGFYDKPHACASQQSPAAVDGLTLTDDEITALAVEHEIEPSDRLKRSVEFDHPSLIRFARAIERALNQRMAGKVGEADGKPQLIWDIYNQGNPTQQIGTPLGWDAYSVQQFLINEHGYAKHTEVRLHVPATTSDQQAKDAALVAFAREFLDDYQSEDGLNSIKYYAGKAHAALSTKQEEV